MAKGLAGPWRRVQLFFRTRVVEGVLMRRQAERFYLILGGHINFQTLSAAVRLDLFGLLKKHRGLTCAEIARHLSVEEKPARILLLGCTALGLLRKSGTRYYNRRLAQRLLVRDAPENVVAIVEWQHHINYRAMHSFYDAIKANRNVGLDEFDGNENTLYERLAHDPKREQIFQDAMEAISVQANRMLAKFVDLSDVRRLVDVGGGNGANAIALVSKYPRLRATVFDSRSVCEIAKENISSSGLAERLDTFVGDCFADEFPTNADCFLFSHFLTIWSEQRNRLLLQKAFDALPSGGKVIVFNMMQHDSRDGPMSAAVASPYFLTLATGEGMLYCWNDYESWMKDAGFSKVERLLLPRDHGAIIGTKV
ncbi:MAG TPA: methyltransferase [Thermoguttaceae bacterium]|nr:methyltransferase [Thermoguttaceae bacterium]